MRKIAVFVEDHAHHEFLDALLQRIARDHDVGVTLDWRNVRRGHGAVIKELKQYMRDLYREQGGVPDLVVVATDANCVGLNDRAKEVTDVTQAFPQVPVVCAIPDPHIERWLLIDSSAFKAVLGRGCQAPDQKCEKARYKKMLIDSILDAGVTPSLGGIEFARDIAEQMDLKQATQQDQSLKRFIDEVSAILKGWQ